MSSLYELTIADVFKGLREKKFSSQEVTTACFSRIEEADPLIHSYLSVFRDSALEQAARADEKIAEGGSLSPLLGVPLAMKDNILIAGSVTTASSKILEQYVAPYDATVIQKLKAEGAVILGKTNMDEFAMGSSTENSAFGATRNPHDAERVPGGSSGGSAAAVAAHECIASLGSDTGGSIRQPASFCGVVGLKPTYGRVSRHGLMAMASSLDQIGPITKTVADSKILFEAIAGSDQLDSTTSNEAGTPEKNLKGLRIGIPKEYFGEGLDSRVGDSVHRALEKLVVSGATLVDISLPHSDYALATYYIIMAAEVSANLARFDGIRYGYSTERDSLQKDSSLLSIYTQSRAGGFGREVKRRIMLGTYTLSSGYYDAYYAKAQKVRRLIQNDFKDAFSRVDVIAGPTSPILPFRFGERTRDPLSMYKADIYTVAINLSGIPALSVPCGTAEEKNSKGLSVKLPVGLQLIGPWFSEHTLFRVSEAVERNLQNHE